ncbi:MAG: two-component system LytT family response regulator [Halieaceae bacterium]|jgi:two-component system LytT family response regulator
MKKINALIIDDEIAAAENISILLDTFCPEINVVEIAHSISKGFQSIKKNNPDLIFLDISMPPECTGFDLLDMLPNRNFHVIFVTAHDQYALKAIKQRAFDYLLKPIDYKELIQVINQFVMTHGVKKNTVASQKIISLSTDDGTHIIKQKDILYCKASGSYTEYHLQNRNPIIISKSLKHAETIVDMSLLKRVHRSYIINTEHIVKVSKEDGGSVFIGNTQIPVSRKYCSDILSLVTLNP